MEKIFKIKDNKWKPISILKKGVEISKKNTDKMKVGAVIFKGKNIFSCGYNVKLQSRKSINREFLEYPNSVHAEINAIINARRDIKGMNIFVVRLRNNGRYGLAKPCKFCRSYLIYTGIKYIYYTNNEGEIIREKL